MQPTIIHSRQRYSFRLSWNMIVNASEEHLAWLCNEGASVRRSARRTITQITIIFIHYWETGSCRYHSTLTSVTVYVCNSLYNSKNETQVAACNIPILIAAPSSNIRCLFVHTRIRIPLNSSQQKVSWASQQSHSICRETSSHCNLTADHTTNNVRDHLMGLANKLYDETNSTVDEI